MDWCELGLTGSPGKINWRLTTNSQLNGYRSHQWEDLTDLLPLVIFFGHYASTDLTLGVPQGGSLCPHLPTIQHNLSTWQQKGTTLPQDKAGQRDPVKLFEPRLHSFSTHPEWYSVIQVSFIEFWPSVEHSICWGTSPSESDLSTPCSTPTSLLFSFKASVNTPRKKMFAI